MPQMPVTRRFWLAVSLLTVLLVAQVSFRATVAANGSAQEATENGRFTGRVVSASGAVVVGGAATNPGHPVAGATVHLVPASAIDVTTPMTASAIYSAPYPAEAYDESSVRTALYTHWREPMRSRNASSGPFGPSV